MAGAITGALALAAFARGSLSPVAFAGCIATAVSAVTDATAGAIFDEIVILGLGTCLAVAALSTTQALASTVVGSIVGFALLGFVRVATRGNGLGFGDVKLGAVIGAALGASRTAFAIGLAFVIGSLCSVPGLISRRRSMRDGVPFGPYLALATALAAVIVPAGIA